MYRWQYRIVEQIHRDGNKTYRVQRRSDEGIFSFLFKWRLASGIDPKTRAYEKYPYFRSKERAMGYMKYQKEQDIEMANASYNNQVIEERIIK